MRNAKTVCITLPPELLKKAQRTAARESRTMSELFREALRHYIGRGAGSSKADQQAELASEDDRSSSVLHSFRMEKPLK